MANQFVEQLERFERRRKARLEFDEEENVEELDVDEEEEALIKPIQRRRTYERENTGKIRFPLVLAVITVIGCKITDIAADHCNSNILTGPNFRKRK